MLGDLLEAGGEAVGVLRPHRVERTQHDQIERALLQFDLVLAFTGRPSDLREPLRSHDITWQSSGIAAPLKGCPTYVVRASATFGFERDDA
jgi:hypothetical protein